MDTNDRQAIEELFGKLREVERRTGPRDAEAEDFIADQVRRQPASPYYMAQTIIVQEQALNMAQRRIEELEALSAGRSGGFFGNIFGTPRAPAPPARTVYRTVPDSGGGGFLAGAAQTALGVAGGVLLANMIAGAFAGGAAYAAEPSDQGGDDGGDYDAGDFDAGGGDFDIGGDF